MALKIERGIPLPSRRGPEAAPIRDATLQMQIGDSIFFAKERSALSAVTILRKHGRKGTMRKVEGGYRTWRIAMDSSALKVAAE